MTYASDETSVDSGEPKELYAIETTDATATDYYLTSHCEDVTHSAQLYTATPIQRDNAGSAIEDRGAAGGEFVFRIASTHALAGLYALGSPPRQATLTVTRLHTTGNAIVFWRGQISGATYQGEWTEIRSISRLRGVLLTQLPPMVFQAKCLNQLYDAQCTRVRAGTAADTGDALTLATTVSTIGSDGVTITIATVGGRPNDFFPAGELVHDDTGERRTILSQAANVLTVTRPYRDMSVSDAVTVYAGCDRDVETCHRKFANVLNFRGFPVIPKDNPHEPVARAVNNGDSSRTGDQHYE